MQFNQNIHDALLDITKYQNNFNINLNNVKAVSKNDTHILLTGANGYLGVHLLDCLIRQGKIVFCGIRAESIIEAQTKLDDNLRTYNLVHLINHQHIKIQIMDLTKPNFGWSDYTWHELSNLITSILHNGAYVHHLQTYQRMASTNVAPINTVINFAINYQLKRIHFISSKYSNINMLNSDYNTTHEGMPSVCPPHADLAFGYTTTKWAAEWLLWRATSYGVPVDIYRLGQISGHSLTGISNYKKNNLTRLILGCIQLGYAPDMLLTEEIIAVDEIAQGITVIMSEQYQKPHGWGVVNKRQISCTELFCLIQSLGYKFDIIPRQEWNLLIRNITEDNLLYPLKDYYDNIPILQAYDYKYSDTYAVLDRNNITISSDYESLFTLYFQYWSQVGFFKYNKTH